MLFRSPVQRWINSFRHFVQVQIATEKLVDLISGDAWSADQICIIDGQLCKLFALLEPSFQVHKLRMASTPGVAWDYYLVSLARLRFDTEHRLGMAGHTQIFSFD